MIKRVRNMQPGDRFILLRTGQRFTFLRRDIDTPSGIKYIVTENGTRESILHHSCHVERINELNHER